MNPRSGVQDKAFALLCCQGNTRGSGDKSLERAFQSLSLKHHVETVHAAVDGSQTAFLPGAGAVYMSGCDYAMVENRWMAIFVGNIENYAYCVKKYCLSEAGLDVGSTYLLETVRALSPLNNAEVVAILFKKLGPTFMSKLRGSFSFVVYDSQVGYVLATNDCNGTHTLWQAHIASDNSLLVACNCDVSITYIERTPIAAGEYKFGWRSMPVPYMASSETVMSKCSEARQAALDALASASVPVEKLAAPSASRSVPRVTNRRHTFTMPRSRPSLSGVYNNIASTSDGAWNPSGSLVAASPPTRPGSYVPPHRRSMSSAQPCSVPAGNGVSRPPPSMPRNMPAARSVDRRASLSDRAQSWRRTESEDLPRITPQDSAAGTPDTFVPMLTPAVEETEARAAQADLSSARLTHALSSIKSAAENSQGEDDEEDLRAAPYYQMATASKLFQPAPVERKVPDAVETGDEEIGCSLSDDEFVWPSQRSHPIPIRASRDSRPSMEATTATGAMAQGDPESQPMAEKNNVNSSVESLVSSSSDESNTAPADTAHNMERPSSLMFPWSEAGSSAPGSVPGLQGQLSGTAIEANGCFTRKDSSSPSLRQETLRPARTSKNASEAKQLLDKVAQSINPAVITGPIAEVESQLSDFPDIGELSFPQLNRQDMHSNTPTMANGTSGKPLFDLEPSVEEEPGESSSSGAVGTPADASSSEASATAQPPANGGMKASGSFSDALQLLLQSRPAGPASAKVKPAFPRPRSGLIHVRPTTAIAPDPSSGSVDMHGSASSRPEGDSRAHDALEGGTEDSCDNAPTGRALDGATPSSSSVPKDLHALPASLLASLTGGDEGDAQEKAALASLLYSSPCALCILDAKAEGQPLVYVNTRFHEETGYTFDDAVGQSYRFLQAAPGGRRHASVASVALDRALARRRNYNGRILNFDKNGTPLWNQLSIVPIRDKSSLEVTHFVGLSTFAAADAQVEEATTVAPLVARGSSHQCLLSLEQENSVRLVPQRSSSYMVLSSLASGDTGTLEWVS